MAKHRHPSGAGAPPRADNVAELRALAHPLRLRIMELFAEGPKTTKRVAELLGEPPTRLYHHVAALERAGLLQLKETRKNRGTVEKWYETMSRTIGSLSDSRRPRGTNASGKRAIAMTVLEQSRREVVNAIAQPGAEPPLLARLVMAAPPAMMPKVRKRLYDFLKEIQTEYECGEPAPSTDDYDRWAMTLTFAPVWPKGPSNDR
jgi:DNA-binding transcriptional ArsR family regulator